MTTLLLSPLLLLLLCWHGCAVTIDFITAGGVANQADINTAASNTQIINTILAQNPTGLQLTIPDAVFYFIGGVTGSSMDSLRLVVDGTMFFIGNATTWPRQSDGKMQECIYFENLSNSIITSSSRGVLNGNGPEWWGTLTSRPRLLHIVTSASLIVEHILLKNSAYWSFFAKDAHNLVIRYTDVDARWSEDRTTHDMHDLTAYNTDGLDVTGRNIHIHDCNIWCQDDCVAVKDDTQNVLVERVQCSGLGLAIGSIGSSVVRNVTFRDAVLTNTVKGIYIKTRWRDNAPPGPAASITDVLYENIVINHPLQFAIWIGTAQQDGQPCSFYFPFLPSEQCHMSAYQTIANITLRDVTINDADYIAAVLLSNASNPVSNLVFDTVVVTRPSSKGNSAGQYYYCGGVHGVATGSTSPVPQCFTDLTTTDSGPSSSSSSDNKFSYDSGVIAGIVLTVLAIVTLAYCFFCGRKHCSKIWWRAGGGHAQSGDDSYVQMTDSKTISAMHL